jgi:PAS domain S-box-containing protein/putative nucleotidyltransferase with HDIG domain
MTRGEIIYLIPYLASLTLAISVFIHVWNRRDAKGAFAFSWYLFSQALWVAGFIMGLVSEDIPTKIFWDDLQWLAGIIAVFALPAFVSQYTETKLRRHELWKKLMFVAPTLFTFALTGDIFFNWIHESAQTLPALYFSELIYELTPLVWGFTIYAYLLIGWSLHLLTRRLKQHNSLYRTQTLLLVVGVSISAFGTVFTLFNIRTFAEFNPTPFAAMAGCLVLSWGFLRYHIFEVTPIGRDKVFEAMVEPVVILDNNNLVSDTNSAMLSLLGKKSQEVIGKPARDIFADFPIPIKQYMQVSYASAEAYFDFGGVTVCYELTVWPIYDEKKEMTGRIYISHDITAQKELERELRKLNSELEDRVRSRTSDLEEAYDTTLEGWARALELRDKETEGHSRRVTEITLKIARAMKISEKDIEQIRRGAILHDIGKMGIPDEILHKPGRLTDEEREVIKGHPSIAYKLLAPIPFLNKAMEIPYSHHERWDGTGYPQGLRGEEIPLAARIFAVADVWDALGSDRCYNAAWEREKIIRHFAEQSGRHFDPVIINTFFSLIEKGEI